jgi:hypothetical protein
MARARQSPQMAEDTRYIYDLARFSQKRRLPSLAAPAAKIFSELAQKERIDPLTARASATPPSAAKAGISFCRKNDFPEGRSVLACPKVIPQKTR